MWPDPQSGTQTTVDNLQQETRGLQTRAGQVLVLIGAGQVLVMGLTFRKKDALLDSP